MFGWREIFKISGIFFGRPNTIFFNFEKSWNFFNLNNAHTKYKHILFNENFYKDAASRDIEQKCVFQRGSFWIFSQWITVAEKGCFYSFKDPLHYFECIKTPKSRKKEKKLGSKFNDPNDGWFSLWMSLVPSFFKGVEQIKAQIVANYKL